MVDNFLKYKKTLEDINKELKKKTNINNFFRSEKDLNEFRVFLLDLLNNKKKEICSNQDLGDFQTPLDFSLKICLYLQKKDCNPEILMEPTCGEGNFIISALRTFSKLKIIYCVDIQPKYEWIFKLNIIKLKSELNFQAEINFYRFNIFSSEYLDIFKKIEKNSKKELLIIGNPPWITNTELSKLDSSNAPKKSNFMGLKGLDALTGKSNFDIAEYIMINLLQNLMKSGLSGKIAFLLKDTVIQKILKEHRRSSINLSEIYALGTNFQKIFHINAHGSLFFAHFGESSEYICKKQPFNENIDNSKCSTFGWVDNKFVSNIDNYMNYKWLEGKSPKIWRHGVKHDLSKVMVLHYDQKGFLLNGNDEEVELEKKFLYPFLKSSDLQVKIAKKSRYKIIITQHKLGQDTKLLEEKAPKLWNYLNKNLDKFNARKSKVYHEKPLFSIFGIGEYTFKPYKIGVSGFYKKLNFCLIKPQNDKTVILDDTSYYLFFENLMECFFTWVVLNFPEVKEFFSSIVFINAKRPYKKEVLMRLNYVKLLEKCTFKELKCYYQENLKNYFKMSFNESDFNEFKKNLIKSDN
ncbi:hypothetical protein DSAG12_01338 [Promethearchaeum syntrophicum]|uniref:N-6 DNA Methylase n=1 Tax=Promethearchaeum syntrophicum TaxID=2594042 RepID=A0A5B9D8U6_9ARCH|nr:hypothetical protein [Candidatus Prometheoarchaeum syntrophicum]